MTWWVNEDGMKSRDPRAATVVRDERHCCDDEHLLTDVQSEQGRIHDDGVNISSGRPQRSDFVL
jgi:hypothetical protein